MSSSILFYFSKINGFKYYESILSMSSKCHLWIVVSFWHSEINNAIENYGVQYYICVLRIYICLMTNNEGICLINYKERETNVILGKLI